MIRINSREAQDLLAQMGRQSMKKMAKSISKALNDAAFQSQQNARQYLQNKFVLRNRFTINSLRFKRTSTLIIREMMSEYGSDAKYMEKQEFGGVSRGYNSPIRGFRAPLSKPVPTSSAASLPKGSRRIRQVSSALRQSRISLDNESQGRSKKQKQFLLMLKAKQTKKPFYADLGRSKGVFKFKGEDLLMIYNMSKKSTRVKGVKFLNRSRVSNRFIERKYIEALRAQLQR